MVFSAPLRPWLLSNVALLLALPVWGAVRYPRLPERIPQHIGTGGVDAWADRSIGSAFVLVFVYAAVTVLTVVSAELTLRMTPRDALPQERAEPFARARMSLVNRPASRASARRIARAVLVLNACVGLSFLVGCGVLWRSTPDPDVSPWFLVATIAPIVAGVVPTVVAAVRDRKA
ncbi:DUF1648 domain-containing protein [Streptomyces meridianus]|uniref:DUF1648 domain-containing protein n=1 Tax=Streptomyces meridianus TaxID=2938945 RepID=A0ABT0X667_9ACTN|nr:DUF1648 domain-containing protein [Streptomyces meridianus]MCM2578019.1 DUF1648 domain-containing protein [Streptomyces meridianus]